MLDFNLLDELMNTTFLESDGDDLDSTYTIGKNGLASMISSSFDQSFSEDNNHSDLSLQDDSPIFELEPKHQKPSSKSNEISLESTEESEFMMSSQGSSSSLKDSHTKCEINGEPSAESNWSVEPAGKASLNEPIDAADVVITKLVQMQKEGTTNFRINGKFPPANKRNSKGHNDVKLAGVKKRKGRASYDIISSRQQPMENAKSQESLEKRN